MTELEAMNMLLRLIGSSPVSSVDTSHPDAANAKVVLDRIRQKAQRRGWWFNLEFGIELEPDEDGRIEIPSTLSTAVFAEAGLIKRSNKVYDTQNQTYIFDENKTVTRAVRILDWDDMPDVVQEYCAYYGAAEYIREELEDESKAVALQETSAASYMDMKKQDLEEAQYNVFNTPRVARARAGVRPYGLGTRRFYGTPDS